MRIPALATQLPQHKSMDPTELPWFLLWKDVLHCVRETLLRLWLGYILVVLPVFRLLYIIVLAVISVALMSGKKPNTFVL